MAAAAISFFGIKGFLQTGADFQTAMADMSSITGATGEDLKFFREETLRMAKASATMAPEVANAFKLVASAKSDLLKDPKGLSKVTEQVLLLKTAASLELSQAANVLLESLNQFGAGADRAAEFVNILAAGSKVGASEVGQTGAAIVKAAVNAKLAGLSFVELNASIQVLAKNGIKAELAGTGLKTMFLALTTQTNNNFNPAIVGMGRALENLSKANLNATEIEKLFGREAFAIGKILIDNRKLVGQWTQEMTGTAVAQEQAAINLNTFNVKMRRLGITIKNVLIRTFLRLEPLLSKTIVKFTEFFDQISEDQIKVFSDNIVDVATGLGNIATSLGDIIGLTKKIPSLPDWMTSGMNFARNMGLKDAAIWGGPYGKVSPMRQNLSDLSEQLLVDVLPSIGAPIGQDSKSTTDINMNINAPAGVVRSMQSTTQGRAANVGLNLREE